MNVREMICIGCPMGCELSVTIDETDNTLSVSGNQCKIGETYGKEEVTNPTRNFTTSIPVTGGDMPMLSVKTACPVPQSALMDCVNALRTVTAQAPVAIGDIVLRDVAGTGVNIVATRTINTVVA